MPLWIACDNNVKWTGASDAEAGTYLNTATVTYALKNTSGTTLSSGSCSYVAASDGDYLGVIDATDVGSSDVTDGEQVTLEITLAQGNYNDFRRITVPARYRP